MVPEPDPFTPILEGLRREEPLELERYLASSIGGGRLAAIKDCFDWNGHHIRTRPVPDVPNGSAGAGPAGIETYTEDRFADHIRDLFDAATGSVTDLTGRLLLSLWVRQSCRKAWGHTYRSDQLISTLEAFNEAALRAWASQDGDALVALALRCNDLLRAEIHTEDQLHTGVLSLHREAVEAVIEVCRGLVSDARIVHEGFGLGGQNADGVLVHGVIRFIEKQVQARLRYNRALLASNLGVGAAVAGDMPELDRMVATVATTMDLLPPDSYIELSEIGALQQSLERFRDNRKPWLRIDRGRISYLFPFGITNLEYDQIPARLQTAMDRRRRQHARGEAARHDVCPTALSTHFTAHADIWNPHAVQRQRFDGIELSFPDVSLDLGDGTVETLKVSIRFSSMGVHCLRLERPVRNLRPHELSAVLRRPLREHGRITISCPGTREPWHRLSQFARTVLNENLPEQLRADMPGAADAPLVHRGRPHVLLRIQHASDYFPGSAAPPSPVREGSRLLSLFGASSLVNAAPASKESIGDWSRLSGGRSKTIRTLRNEGDVLVSNENSTVIAALDTPSHLSAELEALAEFTMSFSGALEAWNHRLNDYRAAVTEIADAYDANAAADKPELLQRMQQERAQLTRFENETRRVIATLYSPSLLRSSVNTAVLRRLLQNSGTDAHVQAFRERLGEVVADQFEATLQRWEQDRQKTLADERAARAQKSALLRESTSVGLGGLGVCAAFQIWQSADFLPSAVWSWATLVVVLLIGGAMVQPWIEAYGRVFVLRLFIGRRAARRVDEVLAGRRAARAR